MARRGLERRLDFHKCPRFISTVLILGCMLIAAVQWLRRTGVGVRTLDVEALAHPGYPRLDAILDVSAGATTIRFAVEEKRRAPYPNEIPNLKAQRAGLCQTGQPLIVVPFVPEALGDALVTAGWSWADAHGNFDLRAPGLMYRQRRTTQSPKPKRMDLPQGSGSLAIVRALIWRGQGEEQAAATTALANQARVTQPRASQVLHRLEELTLVEKTGRGRWRPDREALLDRFLAEYSGPGGSEQFLYSLNSPTEVAVTVAGAWDSRHPIAVSADVGPDLVMAWRRPTLIVVYAKQALDVAELGFVEAQGRRDANVIVRSPSDQSVFPFHSLLAELRGVDVPLADPSQMIWDLQELGGADRLEGAGMLREWLLTRP